MERRTLLLMLILSIPTVLFFSHCQKRDETSPPPKAAEAPSTFHSPRLNRNRREDALAGPRGRFEGLLEITANPELKGRMGRLIVQFPTGTDAAHTRMEVFHPVKRKSLQAGYGNQTVTCWLASMMWIFPRSGSPACRSNQAMTRE